MNCVKSQSLLRKTEIGILIGKSHSSQRHTGVIFYDFKDKKTKVLDVANHHVLREREFTSFEGYFHTIPDLLSEDVTIINALCRDILETHLEKGIPYGFRYDNATFDDDYQLVINKGIGLTCATFVLAIFATACVDLLSISEWEIREEDTSWRESIIYTLQTSRVHSDHIALLKNEPQCVRFRPEEIASAGCEKRPVGFNAAVSSGKKILEYIDK